MARGSRRWILPGGLLAILAVGCSLSALDGFSSPQESLGDGGRDATPSATSSEGGAVDRDASTADVLAPSDAGADGSSGDSSDGLPAHGPNLIVVNPGFELGCSTWRGFNADLYESAMARSGGGACKACTSGLDYPQFLGTFKMPTKAGHRYYVEAWVRAPDTAAKRVNLGLQNGGPTGELDFSGYSTSPPLDASWVRLNAVLEVTKAGDTFDIIMNLGDAIGDCVVIDDFALYEL